MITTKRNKTWLAICLLVASAFPVETAHGCGWWGDGEMQTHNQPTTAIHDDRTLSLQSAKLPGRIGYGIAVPDPGRAVPYLNVTDGRPITGIGELKIFGFLTVIDLGAKSEAVRLHRAETESVGMRYISIPIKGNMPDKGQTERFARTVIDGGTPLLVYAPRAEQLGVMWASYRLWLGSPPDYAIREGRNLGLTSGQAEVLLERK